MPAPPGLPTRFCTLAYAPSHDFKLDPSVTAVLLIVHGEDGKLSLLAHPALSKIVPPVDRPLVEALLRDFAERAQDDPESLFRQLTSLTTGPLVTLSVGDDPLDDAQAKFMIQQFVEFDA